MDMDFMNLNQSAHGDREFGHICDPYAHPPQSSGRLLEGRRHPAQDCRLDARLCRLGRSQDMLIIRFGDQMNNVAVTDGDKVEAEQRMGLPRRLLSHANDGITQISTMKT